MDHIIRNGSKIPGNDTGSGYEIQQADLDLQYKHGFAFGSAWAYWAENTDLHALAETARRRTTEEALQEDKVFTTPFSGSNLCSRELHWRYSCDYNFYAEPCPVTLEADFPNVLFRSFEQGWTDAVREHWAKVGSAYVTC